jgi:hypothetical protein
MQTHTDENGTEKHTMDGKTISEGKKAYRSPRLVIYGDFQRLTMGGGGTARDGGSSGPKTKASGTVQ